MDGCYYVSGILIGDSQPPEGVLWGAGNKRCCLNTSSIIVVNKIGNDGNGDRCVS